MKQKQADTEFYSTYYIKNDKTGRIYNSKL